MWETKKEGGCPRVYEVLGLLGRQAGGGGRASVRPSEDPRVPASGSPTVVYRNGTVWARPGLHLDDDAVLPGGDGSDLGRDLGPTLPLPHLPAPSAYADPDRRLDAHPAGPAAHRIYLPVRPRHAENRRGADHRPSGARLGAARRHVERTGVAGRHQKVNASRKGGV